MTRDGSHWPQPGGLTVAVEGVGRMENTGDRGPAALDPTRLARSLPSWAWAAHNCTMGRLLGVGERKERSEGRGTGLPWDEAEGPIPLATKLPKKASPAERRGAVRQSPGHHHLAHSPTHPRPTPALPPDVRTA